MVVEWLKGSPMEAGRLYVGARVRLSRLLEGYPSARFLGDAEVEVSGIAYDSRQVKPGDLFFCISGLEKDGHDFLSDAIENGARAAVVERAMPVSLPQAVVGSSRAALAPVSARFYGHPSQELTLVGVTGTNGKTTTTFILDSIYRASGAKTGVIGTVITRVGDQVLPTEHTTPEASDLQRLLRDMVEAGVTACAMEVSSHAIDLKRVDACRFAALVFTNLTQDHLDYHGTMEEYGRAKKSIFEARAAGAHVVNVDDPLGRRIAQDCGAATTFALENEADLTATDVELSERGASFTLSGPNVNLNLNSPLRGAFNLYNNLGAAGAALALGLGHDQIARGIRDVDQVPGRFESVDEGQPFTVLVDYAHTPDSLEQALKAARRITRGRLIVVFGCGGDRDAGKRPKMGSIAAELADRVLITSDNPRSEKPEAIVSQIERGALQRASGRRGIVAILDRRKAIREAFRVSEPGDTVLIAGKGHESGQTFADRTVPFDDCEVARDELVSLCRR
ncbi:MAG: UDP-N-acetylmuramoyl-L-alanyl-D-glutamate--2,6-diaminopimelate ligase [Actinobacteria bacterium]|nr:MAG: UDP-N-acetylmuramoyl-L-alanyl-D-glutamate--2,6-diaminopimelate ligase [Actinomycetota bacterium]